MQRHSPRLLVGGCLLFILAGCDARQWPLASEMSGNRAAASPAPKKPSPSTAASAAKPKPVALPRSPSTPAALPDSAVVTPGAINPPSSSGAMPLQLSGLNEQELRSLLGAPTEVETKAPAKIWHYRKEQCALAVSFYPDVQTRVFRILSYEVTGYDGTDQRKHQCWPELRAGAKSR